MRQEVKRKVPTRVIPNKGGGRLTRLPYGKPTDNLHIMKVTEKPPSRQVSANWVKCHRHAKAFFLRLNARLIAEVDKRRSLAKGGLVGPLWEPADPFLINNVEMLRGLAKIPRRILYRLWRNGEMDPAHWRHSSMVGTSWLNLLIAFPKSMITIIMTFICRINETLLTYCPLKLFPPEIVLPWLYKYQVIRKSYDTYYYR